MGRSPGVLGFLPRGMNDARKRRNASRSRHSSCGGGSIFAEGRVYRPVVTDVMVSLVLWWGGRGRHRGQEQLAPRRWRAVMGIWWTRTRNAQMIENPLDGSGTENAAENAGHAATSRTTLHVHRPHFLQQPPRRCEGPCAKGRQAEAAVAERFPPVPEPPSAARHANGSNSSPDSSRRARRGRGYEPRGPP